MEKERSSKGSRGCYAFESLKISSAKKKGKTLQKNFPLTWLTRKNAYILYHGKMRSR
jgi:hypothetical protein